MHSLGRDAGVPSEHFQNNRAKLRELHVGHCLLQQIVKCFLQQRGVGLMAGSVMFDARGKGVAAGKTVARKCAVDSDRGSKSGHAAASGSVGSIALLCGAAACAHQPWLRLPIWRGDAAASEAVAGCKPNRNSRRPMHRQDVSSA